MEMKLLVTGASGFLGWNLCQVAAAQPHWQVYGTYARRSPHIPHVTLLPVDLCDHQQMQALFEQVQPTAVIHLAAMSSPNQCELEPEAAYAINVTATVNLAGWCGDRGIPCVFTSTDLVFDGQNAPYRETDPISPISRYGEQKAISEVEALKRYPEMAVCRMPLMFGEAPPTASSFLQPFLNNLREGKSLNLFTDEYRTPICATTASQGLLLALEKAQGILHLGGKERLSRYDFGQLMVEAFDVPNAQITPCRQCDVQMAAPRPPDVSMDSSKAFTLGYNPRSVREALLDLRGKV